MTQKQENALKILYRLKSEEHIDFEEYFTLIESIIGENRILSSNNTRTTIYTI